MATKEELQSLRSRLEQLSEEHVYSPATSFASLLAILDGILHHLIHQRDITAGLTGHHAASDAPVENHGLQINLGEELHDDANFLQIDPNAGGAQWR